MKKTGCDRLDDYLLGCLSADESGAFDRHLADCPQCRREKDLQGRIDDAVQAARSQPQPIPPWLMHRIHRRVRTARIRRAARLVCALAAAALLMLLPGRMPFPTSDSPLQPEPEAVARDPASPAEWPWRLASAAANQARVARATPPRVRPLDPSSAILVPMPSKNPDVTIVWVYPTVKLAGEGPAKTNAY